MLGCVARINIALRMALRVFRAGKQVLDAMHEYMEYRAGERKTNAVGTKRIARRLVGMRCTFALALDVFDVIIG